MKSRADIFRGAFAEEAERNKSIHAINSEYRRLLEYARSNERICEQEQDGDVSLASVLIRYIESVERELADFKNNTHYVWCNIAGDAKDGGFSDSWDEEIAKRAMTLKEIQEFQEKHPESRSYKLIAYRCLSDPEFVFNKNMKLR